MSRALVTDFDGTMTRNDFYLLVLERAAPEARRYWDEYLRGQRTHFESMREVILAAGPDPARLDELVDAMEPEPGLRDAVRALQLDSWEVIVASAGSSWYIDRILGRLGIEVTVHANPGRLVAGLGLELEPPRDSPFYGEGTGIDKEAVLRDAQDRHEIVAYAGDGPPDLGPSLLVPPERRFARGWLAEELHRRGERFEPFAGWPDIAARLVAADTAT